MIFNIAQFFFDTLAKEDIIITKNGNRTAKLSDATNDKTDIVTSLVEILPNNISENDAREERLAKHDEHKIRKKYRNKLV